MTLRWEFEPWWSVDLQRVVSICCFMGVWPVHSVFLYNFPDPRRRHHQWIPEIVHHYGLPQNFLLSNRSGHSTPFPQGVSLSFCKLLWFSLILLQCKSLDVHQTIPIYFIRIHFLSVLSFDHSLRLRTTILVKIRYDSTIWCATSVTSQCPSTLRSYFILL